MFRWKAVYNDNTFLNQFNSDNTENKYTAIKRDELKQFIIFSTNKNEPLIVVHFTRPSQKLIYRQRVAMGVDSKIKRRVVIVGWQENVQGKNVQHINFVWENGFIETMDRFNPEHRLFYPIRFLPCEEVG
jgi:hypothetical protein